MPDIDEDISFYKSISAELESKHTGKWVLIHNKEVIVIYDSFDDAAKEAVKLFGQGPYLIKQIGAPPVILPVSVAYILKNA
jgi:hypothetical protein